MLPMLNDEKRAESHVLGLWVAIFGRNQFTQKNEIVQDQSELHDLYERWQDALPDLLAQDVITDPDSLSWICSCTFDQNHALLDCGVKQKTRSMPAHFGGSTNAVRWNNHVIAEFAKELGKQLKYVGHAGIEFRWDDPVPGIVVAYRFVTRFCRKSYKRTRLTISA
jgi:predicted ATP-grasp superfamily ATP-dependent carboligase